MADLTQTPTLPSLDGVTYISLTTFRKSGIAVETPVWFAPHNGTLYVYSGADAGKVKRLRHTSRVTLAPCTYRGAITGPTTVASARLVSDQAEINVVRAALARKYGWQYRLLAGYSAFRKEAIAYIAITPLGV